MRTTVRLRTALQPFRHRDYRILWLGTFVSQVGSQMQVVALAWQVYQLTGDTVAVGSIALARVVPMIALALAGGVVADASDRRKLLLGTQTLLLAISATLAWATARGLATVPLLYVATALAGAIQAVDNPAQGALVPNLVPPEDLPRALNARILAWQTATIAGPAAGGIVLEWRGPAAVYAIDAASYLAILVSLLGVRYRPVSAPELRPSFRAALEGIKLLRSLPILWATTLLDFFATFFAGAMLLLPFFSAELGVGKRGYGFLYAAPSAGAVLAALVLSTLDPPKRPGLVVLVSVAAYGLATAAFGASPSFWLAILFLALSGAADMVSTSIRHTLRQELTPNPLRGRLNSVSLIFFAGGPLLGEVEAGVVAKVLGVRGSIVSGGIACVALVGLFAWAAPWLRRYRRGDPAGASTLAVPAPEQAPRCP